MMLGETRSGPAADPSNPQPESATKAQHAIRTSNSVNRLSSLRIGLRLYAQYELNNGVTSVPCVSRGRQTESVRASGAILTRGLSDSERPVAVKAMTFYFQSR